MDTKERRADADFKVPEMSEYQETSEYQTTGQRPDFDRALMAPGAAEAAADELEKPASISRGTDRFFSQPFSQRKTRQAATADSRCSRIVASRSTLTSRSRSR